MLVIQSVGMAITDRECSVQWPAGGLETATAPGGMRSTTASKNRRGLRVCWLYGFRGHSCVGSPAALVLREGVGSRDLARARSTLLSATGCK